MALKSWREIKAGAPEDVKDTARERFERRKRAILERDKPKVAEPAPKVGIPTPAKEGPGFMDYIREGIKREVRSHAGFVWLAHLQAAKPLDQDQIEVMAYDPFTMESPMEVQEALRQQDMIINKKRAETAGRIFHYIETQLRPKDLRTGDKYKDYVGDVIMVGPQMFMQAASHIFGGRIGSALYMGTGIMGNSYMRMRDAGVSHDNALLPSFVNAGAQAMLETMGMQRSLSRWRSRGGKGFKNVAERFANATGAGVFEAMTEWAQNFPEQASYLYATGKENGLSDGQIFSAIADSLVETAKDGLYDAAVAGPWGFLFGFGGGNINMKQETDPLGNVVISPKMETVMPGRKAAAKKALDDAAEVNPWGDPIIIPAERAADDPIAAEQVPAETAETEPDIVERVTAIKQEDIDTVKRQIEQQPALADITKEPERAPTPQEVAAEEAAVTELGVLEEAPPVAEEVAPEERITEEEALRRLEDRLGPMDPEQRAAWRAAQEAADTEVAPAEPTVTERLDSFVRARQEQLAREAPHLAPPSLVTPVEPAPPAEPAPPVEERVPTRQEIIDKFRRSGFQIKGKVPTYAQMTQPAVRDADGNVFLGDEVIGKAPTRMTNKDLDALTDSFAAARTQTTGPVETGFVVNGIFASSKDIDIAKGLSKKTAKARERREARRQEKAAKEEETALAEEAAKIKDVAPLTKKQNAQFEKLKKRVVGAAYGLSRGNVHLRADLKQVGFEAALDHVRSGTKTAFKPRYAMLNYINEQSTYGMASRGAMKRGLPPRVIQLQEASTEAAVQAEEARAETGAEEETETHRPIPAEEVRLTEEEPEAPRRKFVPKKAAPKRKPLTKGQKLALKAKMLKRERELAAERERAEAERAEKVREVAAAPVRERTIFDQIEAGEKDPVATAEKTVSLKIGEEAYHDFNQAALVMGDARKYKERMDIIDHMRNERGMVAGALLDPRKSPVVKALKYVVKKGLGIERTVVDWLDVEAPWKRIKADATGLALKTFYSRRSRLQLRGMVDARNIVNRARSRFGRDLTQREWLDVLFTAENQRLMDQLEDGSPMKETARDIRTYFDQKDKDYKNRGVKYDFKARQIRTLQEKLDSQRLTVAEAEKLEQKIEDIKQLNFVHIPVAVLYGQTLDQMSRKRLPAKRRKTLQGVMNLFVEKKRQRLSLQEIYESANEDQRQFMLEVLNPVSVVMNYANRYAKDMAILDIRDALMKDKLAKSPEAKKPAHFVTLPDHQSWGVLKGYHLDRRAEETLINLHAIDRGRDNFEKVMNTLKMAAFYNPIFLPIYDVFQSGMSGAHVGSKTVFTMIPNAARAIKHASSNSDIYQEAAHWGLFSKPFDLPFDEWAGSMQDVMKSKNVVGMIGRRLLRQTLDWRRGGPLKAAYHASWSMAWKMDETVRMWTYLQLREKGMSAQDAAQTAATFHGDYASVPPKSRKTLNKIFFTPTFKIVMFKAYGKMMKNTIQGLLNVPRGKVTDVQRQMALGLLSMAAIQIAFDWFLGRYGLEPDDEGELDFMIFGRRPNINYGRKYKQRADTKYGPKNFILTWSNPANMLQRYFDRALRTVRGFRKNPFNALLDLVKWDLHPIYRTGLSLSMNRNMKGAPIFNENEDPYMIGLKGAYFTASDLIRITEAGEWGLSRIFPGVERFKTWEAKEASAYTKRVFGPIMKTLIDSPISVMSGHLRDIDDIRFMREMRRMKRSFNTSQKRYFMSTGEINKKWLKNYQNRIIDEIRRRERKRK